MAIKISNNTIIDDSRNVINAKTVGIGTTLPTSELTVNGDVLINDWNFSSFTLSGIATISPVNTITGMRGLFISKSNEYLYTVNDSNIVYKIPTSNVGLSTNYYLDNSTSLISDTANFGDVGGLCFDNTGHYLYANSRNNNTIVQWTLPIAWRIDSIGNQIGIITTTSIVGLGTSFRDLEFSSDGSKLYFANDKSAGQVARVFELTLNTPWLLSSGISTYKSTTVYDTYTSGANIKAFTITEDGNYWLGYGANGNSSPLNLFQLRTPWDITTSVGIATISFSGLTTTFSCGQMILNDSGDELYIGSLENFNSSTAAQKIYKISNVNSSNNQIKIIGEENIHGILNTYGTFNSYGTINALKLNVSSLNSNGPISQFRNVIINGDHTIRQRYGNTTLSAWGNAGNRDIYSDRWIGFENIGGFQMNASIKVLQPTDCNNHIVALGTTTVLSSSPASNDYCVVEQFIPYFKIDSLKWGTPDAAPVTLSFWVRSSIAGTYSVVISEGDTFTGAFIRSNYSILQTNTWEQKVITFPGPFFGDWKRTITYIGMRLSFILSAGSSLRGLNGLNQWQDASQVTAHLAPSGGVNLSSTLNATWDFTGIQLEQGTISTPYEFIYQLSECQLFYQNSTLIFSGSTDGSSSFTAAAYFSAPMLGSPTITLTNFSNSGFSTTPGSVNILTDSVSGLSHGLSETRTSNSSVNGGSFITLVKANSEIAGAI